MPLTLGLTGMDPATETALKATFLEANARLGEQWTLVSDAEAGHVVVDMDSMYGPMSWLRLHAAGKQVIGLTSAPRTQTDYRLGRPFDPAQMAELLAEIAGAQGVDLKAAAAGAPAGASAPPPVDPAPVEAPAMPEAPAASEPPAPPVAAEPAPAPAAVAPEAPEGATPAGAAPAEAPAPAAPAAPAVAASGPVDGEGTLAAWLAPGALGGRVRYRSGAGPTLYIDAGADTWHGPTPLKPTAACFGHPIRQAEFEPLDDDAWAREAPAAGEAQPLSRLRWLGGLLAGNGALLPGVDPEGRFQLLKWPQTEREYPRHFRIATQMMKGPATVAEIASASGVPEADVADFINANLATGFAAAVVDAPEPPAEAAKPRVGLLGRLRSR